MGCCCGKDEIGEKAGLTNPIKNRSCTDILVLILFVLFWAGMIYISAFSITHGDAFRLVYGYDSFGNTCDEDNSHKKIPNVTFSGMNQKGRPYVFLMDIQNPSKSLAICVNKCPDTTFTSLVEVKKFSSQSGSLLCDYSINRSDYSDPNSDYKFKSGITGPCPVTPVFGSTSLLNYCVPSKLTELSNITASKIVEYFNQFDVFQKVVSDVGRSWREMLVLCIIALVETFLYIFYSEPLLNRCIPKELTVFSETILKNIFDFLNDSDIFHRVLSDLYSSWREMIILCFVALGFASLMVILIRFLASIIVWFIVALTVVASIVLTAFLWWSYVDKKNNNDFVAKTIPLLDVDINSERAFLIYSIIATVLTVILLLVLLILRKRIALVVALFQEAGKCLVSMPCLLIQPLWTFIILIVFFVYWTIVLAYLSTSEKASLGENGFVKYTEHETVSYFWWYHLIGLIWTSEFIIACQQFVVSGAVATWYFTRDRNQLSCTICKSISLLIFHHIGSVAFGAFIITLVKLPRWILMYLSKKLKNSQNKCAEYCMKCCICCLWCLEKCLKYLNQNAYTVVAIRGSNFCSSAKKAFMTLISNSLRVAAINSVGDFVLFLGKLGVTAATAAVGIIWLKGKEDLHYFAVPVLLVCVFAYFIAHCFLSTYEMVIDALLLCFCEDVDINDGSTERPYFASSTLHKFIEEKSHTLNEMTRGAATEEETEPARV